MDMVGSGEDWSKDPRFIEARALRPVIDRTFPFAEFPAAMAHLESGAQFGKVGIAF